MDCLGRRLLPILVAGIVGGICSHTEGQDAPLESDAPPAAVENSSIAERLKERVAKLRAEKKLVGLAAMITRNGKLVATSADGERALGGGVAVTSDDRWHLGSITKSMTATMIARLVEKKQLSWTATVGECFGEDAEVHVDYRGVTLAQLLTHTAGFPSNFPIVTQFQRPPEGKQRVQARKAAVIAMLKFKPQSKPGELFQYSNVGFTVAAVMAEEETGKSWEDLIRQEIFKPLGLGSAGFGPPKDGTKKRSQPRGHQRLGFFTRVVGQDEDNSPIMGPAGAVHMSLADLCHYGNEHLRGEVGKGKLLPSAAYQRLHRPRLDDYACGWVAPKKNKWTAGRIIWHNGSNTMWYALLAILPEQDMVIAITSNDGDMRRAEAAAFQIVEEFSK